MVVKWSKCTFCLAGPWTLLQFLQHAPHAIPGSNFVILQSTFSKNTAVNLEMVSLLGQVNVLAVEYPGYGICPGGQAKTLECLTMT